MHRDTTSINDPFAQGFSDDATISNGLPAKFYTDPDIFAHEREKIFFRNWLFAGHVTDIPQVGEYFTTKIFNQSIIVIRNNADKINAFYNVCRHRGHELLNGKGKVARISCPYHAWTYALDGELVGVRNANSVKNFSVDQYPLSQVQVEILAGLIFINLDTHAPSLADTAPGLDEEIRMLAPRCDTLLHAHRDEHIMKCNWKIAAENWSECYHCTIVHPPLATEFIDFTTFRIELHPLYQRQRMKLRENIIEQAGKDNASIAGDEQASWTLLPNLGIQIVHGGYMMTSQWQPVDPDHCRFVEDWYLPSAEATDHQRELFRFRAEHTQPEDLAVCEGVQRGLHSRGYQHGRLMVDADFTELSEHGSHHIQQWVVHQLKGP